MPLLARHAVLTALLELPCLPSASTGGAQLDHQSRRLITTRPGVFLICTFFEPTNKGGGGTKEPKPLDSGNVPLPHICIHVASINIIGSNPKAQQGSEQSRMCIHIYKDHVLMVARIVTHTSSLPSPLVTPTRLLALLAPISQEPLHLRPLDLDRYGEIALASLSQLAGDRDI